MNELFQSFHVLFSLPKWEAEQEKKPKELKQRQMSIMEAQQQFVEAVGTAGEGPLDALMAKVFK